MHTCDFSRELVAKNSQHIEKSVCRDRTKPIQYYSNCWKPLKLTKPQHNNLMSYKCEGYESRKN